MTELKGQAGELRFTLEITRAATGEKETVELVGLVDGLGGDENEKDDANDEQ